MISEEKLKELGFTDIKGSNRYDKYFNLRFAGSIKETDSPVDDFPTIYTGEEILIFALDFFKNNLLKNEQPFFGYIRLSVIPTSGKINLRICDGNLCADFKLHDLSELKNYIVGNQHYSPTESSLFFDDDDKGMSIMLKKKSLFSATFEEEDEEEKVEEYICSENELDNIEERENEIIEEKIMLGFVNGYILKTIFRVDNDPYCEFMGPTNILKIGPQFHKTIDALLSLMC